MRYNPENPPKCVYCGATIMHMWMSNEKLVLSYKYRRRVESEHGEKYYYEKVINEMCCRPCYFHEVMTNEITLHK